MIRRTPSGKSAALALVMIAVTLFCIWQLLGWLAAVNPPAIPVPPTFVYGNAKARFTLIEYADLECPYCKDAFPQLKQLIDRHDSLNWQWHHLPLAMHGEAALYEARLVTCAGWLGGNTTFWQAVMAIYQHSSGNGAGLAVPIDQLGLQSAVSLQHLQECTQSNATVRRIIAEQTVAAAKKRVDATPTLELRDNSSGRLIRLPSLLDDAGMLSAMDWLAGQEGVDEQRQ